MRRTTYLNVILTINAVLLTALLWSALAGQPLLINEATAQSVVPQIPNAAAQRYEMIARLRQIQEAVQETNSILSGGLKVEVKNLDSNRGQ